MKEIIFELEMLRNTMPISFSLLNIQALKTKTKEFKLLVNGLPTTYTMIKIGCANALTTIKNKIENFDRSFLSQKAKNNFQETVSQLKRQIDLVLFTLKTTAS